MSALEKRLKEVKAMENERDELLGAGAPAIRVPEKPKEEWTAHEYWDDTDQTQDRTLQLADEAVRAAHQGIEEGNKNLEKMQEIREKEIQIIKSVEELKMSYGISFRVMFTIIKGLACDTCFQVLIGVLIMAII